MVALSLISPEPTTAMSMPHSATIAALWSLMPPSIISLVARPPAATCASMADRNARTLPSTSGMNDCPPLPGTTDITSTRSSSGRRSITASAGVAGLSTQPA